MIWANLGIVNHALKQSLNKIFGTIVNFFKYLVHYLNHYSIGKRPDRHNKVKMQESTDLISCQVQKHAREKKVVLIVCTVLTGFSTYVDCQKRAK